VSHTDSAGSNETVYFPFSWSPDSRYILGTINSSCGGAHTVKARHCRAATPFGATLIDIRRGVLARYPGCPVNGAAFSPDSRMFALGFGVGAGSSQAANYEGRLELGSTARPKRLRLLGGGEQPAWGRPGLAFLRLDTKAGLGDFSELDLVAAPGGPPRALFTRQMPNGDRLAGIVGWTAGAGDLLAGLSGRFHTMQTVQPVLIDPRNGAMQYFPQQLMSISAISRDGSRVLGESLQGEVVAVRADGNVKVLASHAVSATWTS